tara:strand:+ start:492 stop:692 length:201 start_codon:yes stop_codon:yes gene_type:complete
MSLQRISRQIDQDVSYLLWQASVHQQSPLDTLSRFSALADNYRQLVPVDKLDQLEKLILSYRSRLN